MPSGLEELLSNLKGGIGDARTTENAALQEAVADPGYSKQQAFYAGLVGLAPLIAGLIKGGNRNIYRGAQAGLVGTQLVDKQIQDENEKSSARAILKAKQATEDRKTLEKQAFDVQRDIGKEEARRTTKEMFPSKGLTVQLPGDVPKAVGDEVLPRLNTSQRISGFIKMLKEINPIKQAYVDPETGELNLEQMGTSLSEGAKSILFGPESKLGKLDAEWQQTIQELRKELLGVAQTPQETKNLEIASGRNGLFRANTETLVPLLERFIEKQRASAINAAKLYSKGKDREEVIQTISSMFDESLSPYQGVGQQASSNALSPEISSIKSQYDLNTSEGRSAYLGHLNKIRAQLSGQ